jgi:hypothetical protein
MQDGFPTLDEKIFMQPTIKSAMIHGFEIAKQKWPWTKDRYPAVASRRSQVLTYSLDHFMVSLLHSHVIASHRS